MTTNNDVATKETAEFYQSVRGWLKRVLKKDGKKNPDWARIQEPDTFLPPVVLLIFTLIITVSAGMINYVFAEPGTLENMIAQYLKPFVESGQSFNQVYAVFTFAILAIMEALVYTFISILQTPDTDDIAEMIRDLDDNTQDRIVELENTINERLQRIENETLPFSSSNINDDVLSNRIASE